MNTCKTCKWWKKTNHFEEGECRANAPAMVVLDITNTAPYGLSQYSPQWPRTREQDFCGAHTPAESKE